MKTVVTLALAVQICGCAMIPQERGELLQSGPRSERYCYAERPAEITDRIRTYLVGCYRPVTGTTAAPVGGVFVPIQTSFYWKVEEEKLPAGTQFNVKSRYGYVLEAEITGPEKACASVLQVYAGNTMWTNRFETLDKVAKKEKVDCPY